MEKKGKANDTRRLNKLIIFFRWARDDRVCHRIVYTVQSKTIILIKSLSTHRIQIRQKINLVYLIHRIYTTFVSIDILSCECVQPIQMCWHPHNIRHEPYTPPNPPAIVCHLRRSESRKQLQKKQRNPQGRLFT